MYHDALVIGCLATWQVVEVWHHSALFATARAELEPWADLDGWRGRLGELFGCPFCLSLWVALLFVTCWELVIPLRLPLLALAVARLANLGNDVFHHFCRTPGSRARPGSGDEQIQ